MGLDTRGRIAQWEAVTEWGEREAGRGMFWFNCAPSKRYIVVLTQLLRMWPYLEMGAL